MQSTPRYQTFDDAIDQIKSHYSGRNCSVSKDDYESKITIHFHESEKCGAFRFDISRDIFNRKSRLQEHLESIDRRLVESGRI